MEEEDEESYEESFEEDLEYESSEEIYVESEEEEEKKIEAQIVERRAMSTIDEEEDDESNQISSQGNQHKRISLSNTKSEKFEYDNLQRQNSAQATLYSQSFQAKGILIQNSGRDLDKETESLLIDDLENYTEHLDKITSSDGD